MTTVLDRIASYKRDEVKEAKAARPLSAIREMVADTPPPKAFHSALSVATETGFGLITEIKKASPSKGVICADFAPCEVAAAYQRGGATCLSILTDGPSFQGSLEDLRRVALETPLPCLRKDFLLDPYQVWESRIAGADCILLIMAVLSDSMAREIEEAAIECGMDCLVEVHNAEELARAKTLKSRLIGVNNRDLRDFSVSLSTTIELLPFMPPESLVVAESGLSYRDDLNHLAAVGVRCFLIGESLMRAVDREMAVHNLLNPPFRARSGDEPFDSHR
ncbi:MAG: indole-3-glycerol phosphate synthase TrpC [Rhodobacteraceae bacterium]|nr:indole-3-glycerol phosphate synthase TrpC [Paracoccaceae bacterium]MCY4328315.1 indole-3-glycerol phosphate synthase TrpC [Paracoccaceae bacterium]